MPNLIIDICTHEAPHDSSGGPFIWAQRMPLELRKLGYEVNIKLLVWHKAGEGTLSKFFRKEGFNLLEKKIGYTEDTIKWLLNNYKTNAPDIVIISMDVHCYYAVPWLKKAGIRVVGVIRSDDDFYHGIIEQFVFGRSKFRVSAVVSVSKHLTSSIVKRKPKNVLTATIPSGTVIPDKSIQKAEKFRIAYVGRIVQEQKRIIDLTKSFVRLENEVKNIESYIIGGGPQQEEVRAIIKNSASKKVHFPGRMKNDEVVKFLLSCHVIVLLSDYEGTPTSVMEGMACGCVPVCLDIRSGIPELVIHNKTGILVNNRHQDFINAISSLKNDSDLWETLSISAREHIRKNFSVQASALKWRKIIKELYKNQQKRQIEIPKKINLPGSRSGFERQDKRVPKKTNIEKARFILGKYKRLFQKLIN